MTYGFKDLCNLVEKCEVVNATAQANELSTIDKLMRSDRNEAAIQPKRFFGEKELKIW